MLCEVHQQVMALYYSKFTHYVDIPDEEAGDVKKMKNEC